MTKTKIRKEFVIRTQRERDREEEKEKRKSERKRKRVEENGKFFVSKYI